MQTMEYLNDLFKIISTKKIHIVCTKYLNQYPTMCHNPVEVTFTHMQEKFYSFPNTKMVEYRLKVNIHSI